MILQAIIEIPSGTNIKYEYDENHNLLRCDRILNTSMSYPGNYGYIPNTLGGDGDPLDILVLCDYQINPGVIIECKVLGVLLMEDEEGLDEKIIAIPSDNVDPTSKFMNQITDISPIVLEKIKHFYEHYKDNDTEKWSQVKEYQSKDTAIELIHNYTIHHKI